MKDNKPLILLHGALGSRDQFSELEKSLSDDFDVYSLNFEGHGGRTSKRGYSMPVFTENVLHFMEEKKLSSANFFGFSMGGYVALTLALEHPAKVGKIMTLGTKFDWSPESSAKEVGLLNPLKIEEKVPAFAQKLKERHHPVNWEEVLSKTGKMMLDLGEGQALNKDDFEKIKCPVLISVGSQDQTVGPEESQRIAELLPQGKFRLFENVKHPIEQVDIQMLKTGINEFFQG